MQPHLHPRLAQPQALAEVLPHKSIRVVRLVEKTLQLVQLLQCEVRARPALLHLQSKTINIYLGTTHQILQFHSISISGKQSYKADLKPFV